VVHYDPKCTGPRDIINKLTDLGYSAQLWDSSDGQHNAIKYAFHQKLCKVVCVNGIFSILVISVRYALNKTVNAQHIFVCKVFVELDSCMACVQAFKRKGAFGVEEAVSALTCSHSSGLHDHDGLYAHTRTQEDNDV
jgi:hypothetical protein